MVVLQETDDQPLRPLHATDGLHPLMAQAQDMARKQQMGMPRRVRTQRWVIQHLFLLLQQSLQETPAPPAFVFPAGQTACGHDATMVCTLEKCPRPSCKLLQKLFG